MAFSHQRDALSRVMTRVPGSARIAAPVATVATLGVVAAGVLVTTPTDAPEGASTALVASPLSATINDAIADRAETVSRSASSSLQVVASGPKIGIDRERQRRLAAARERRATAAAVAAADTKLWVTSDLNLWSTPSGGSNLGVLEEGEQVLVTGREASGRSEVVVAGKSRWVTSDYLSADKPEPEPDPEPEATETEEASGSTPSAGGTCSNGSSVSGKANVIKVHQAVCAAFPSITSYGTYRSDGEHAQGIAIDIMVSGGTGYQVADFVRANYRELGVSYVIYSQRIWSVQRGSEGWRGMSDRGSTTANHYDHVHVTTY